ncbi:MAG TPA: choice-of-anchor X domain-containing protein, partial [Longimicrobiaceae bacterium]|nr:choice-of-anchor X domain-containing protein [Longimicrobiaceae bacterium]
LLLSDGLQNRPGTTLLPADAGYDPCPAVAGFNPCPAGTVSNVPVSTVAFGQGTGDVDEGLLNEIRGRYLGDFGTSYDLASNVEDLKETFINGLEDLYTTNLIYSGVNPVSFVVEPGVDRLVAIASWTDAAQAENIALQRDDGGFETVDCSVPAASNTTVGFAVCAIDNPEPGEWKVVAAATGGAFDDPMSRLFVVVDLQLRARFGVEPAAPGTGEPLLLTAELRDAGRPVLHSAAGPVRVTVRVETPEEGLGTFASTHDPQSCRTVRPQLPKLDPVVSLTAADPAGGQRAQTPFMAASAAAAAAAGDPDPPLYALVSRLLEACGREGLARGQDPGLELRDDGTGGDAVAGDGVYSLRYDGADVAGSYVFRFDVDGTTPDGERFTRTRRTGRYVRVQPTAAASETGSRLVQQGGGLAVREFHILPRDRFGGYLGPGMAHKVDFVKTAGPGSFAGPVIDYGNGWYARRVQYDPSQGEPVVTPTVYGRPLAPVGRPGGRGRFELGVFGGATFFPDELGIEDGPAAGARLGFRLGGPLVLEAEGASTSTEDLAANGGRVVQLLGAVRLDLAPGAALTPFLRAGAGQVLFRGFPLEDEAAAYHAGGGLTAWLAPSLGIRAEARALRIEDVLGAGATDSYQGTAGVVLRF